MDIVIVGPGALGCLLAARLHQAGRCPIRLLDHDPDRAALLNRQGIILADGDSASPPLMIPTTPEPATVAGAGVVLLCVKAFALPTALAAITPYLTPATLLIALQNGISHLETLRALAGRGLPALGVSTEGATLLAPGRVRSGGAGLTRLGYPEPPGPAEGGRLAAAAAQLSQAGIRSELSPDIQRELWRKLIINAGINALTVIHDCPNGELLERPEARRTMAQAAREAAAVAAAAGAAIEEDPGALCEEVCRHTATNISSMLQDVRRGKPTEILAINGEVVRRAAEYGLAAPINRKLLAQVRQLASFTSSRPRS